VQLERVTGFLQSGKEEGARTVTGGGRHGKAGYCVEPTVPDGTRETMRVYQEEIFGPVVTVQPFKEIDDELIRRTNDTLYGLAAGIWTGNLQRAHRIAHQLRAGTVWITATTSSTRRCRSAATSNPAGGGRWVTRCSTAISRPKAVCMSI
jgi:phenylacetaldehyde dehydrogenase